MEIKAGIFSKRLVLVLPIVIGSVPLDSISKGSLPMERLHQKPSERQLKERWSAADAACQNREGIVQRFSVLNSKYMLAYVTNFIIKCQLDYNSLKLKNISMHNQ